jgi:DedD protein
MTEDLKKRLIGAAVLVSLAVIFIPVLIEEQPPARSISGSNIPSSPPITHEENFLSEKVVEEKRAELAFGSSVEPASNSEIREISSEEQQSEVNESGTVSVPVPRVGLTSWMIQAGAFSSRENAEKLVEKLRDAGYDTHLETAEVNSLTVFRVRVGPEIDRGNADRMADKISKTFFVSAKVIQYP